MQQERSTDMFRIIIYPRYYIQNVVFISQLIETKFPIWLLLEIVF